MVEMLFYFELFTILQGLCSVLSFCAEHSAFTARIFGKILCLYIFFVYSIYSVDLNNVGIFFSLNPTLPQCSILQWRILFFMLRNIICHWVVFIFHHSKCFSFGLGLILRYCWLSCNRIYSGIDLILAFWFIFEFKYFHQTQFPS